MQPVRLLLIGAGVIGRTHIDRIGRDPHLALAGIAEPSEAVSAGPPPSAMSCSAGVMARMAPAV